MIKLDTTDAKLLGFLQEDCKKTTKQYARLLNLSTTAVYERIKRLERLGAIGNYVALVNKKKINLGFMVLCHVKLVQHSKEFVLQFERDVVKLQEVVECYHVSGDYDYIVKVYVRDMEAYREFMVTKLTVLHHIGSTHSTFMISEIKNTTAVLVEQTVL